MTRLFVPRLWPIVISLVLCSAEAFSETEKEWRESLESKIAEIDAMTPGSMGVYIKRLSDGAQVSYQASRKWYLASTVKVPLAVAVLQLEEEGKLSLRQELSLQATDYVDGSGDLLSMPPGTRLPVRTLLEKMLVNSDSTAADMLMRLVGIDRFNARVKDRMVAEGFGTITSLLDVRYGAYSELHPRAKELTNRDFINFKKWKDLGERVQAFLQRLGLRRKDLRAHDIEEAFERYYRKELNSASLEAYGRLLEKLTRRQLLSEKNTELILGYMEKMVTGDKRIKAGLSKRARFFQKTGTQVGRMCNVGIVSAAGRGEGGLIIAACLEKFTHQGDAENALRRIGMLLG